MSLPEETRATDSEPTIIAGSSFALSDMVTPLLVAAAAAAGVGVLFLFILTMGDLPFVAHPGLILLVSAVIIAVVALLLRADNVPAASAVAGITVAALLGYGLLLMLFALGIQLSEGNTDDARESVALLIIAPTTTLLGFVVVPAIKAARVITSPGEKTVAASRRQVLVSQIVGVGAFIMGVVGFVGMLLGALDWSRGIAPTDSPFTLFAGLFATLGAVLIYLLSRTIGAPATLPET